MEEEDGENEMQDERSRSKRIMKIAGQKRKSMNRSRSKGTKIVKTSQEEVRFLNLLLLSKKGDGTCIS